MILFEQGKAYWEIARRYHTNRATSKAIGPTAVRDMQRLLQTTKSQAVMHRINTFVTAHTKPTPQPA